MGLEEVVKSGPIDVIVVSKRKINSELKLTLLSLDNNLGQYDVNLPYKIAKKISLGDKLQAYLILRNGIPDFIGGKDNIVRTCYYDILYLKNEKEQYFYCNH